ncbi:hypothetical protein [Corallococcus sp. CA047B]|uniref:hypothetical protein n=1 Tax=Corallococcus sp. CA047B TaxID=2316729 RepID=UPI0011C4087A|nr:hypothetical protein [Corallococcus sp. CA047B]
MHIVSILKDERINATSVLVEMTIADYIRLISGAEENLSIQRTIVKGFKPYERLRDDLAKGCLIPAPVLAAKLNTIPIPKSIDDAGFTEALSKTPPANIYIVDGLQRTNAIQHVLKSLPDEQSQERFNKRPFRVELWPDITLPALTYRMILLNAGQKPMSLRHQIEVVSNALCDTLTERYGSSIAIYREKDASRRSEPGQYQFSLLATALQAFIQKSPHIDLRNEVVEELTKIDALETYGRTVGTDSQDNERDPTEAFIDYIGFLIEFDKRLWTLYEESQTDVNGDMIPSARTLLTRDTFHLGLAAAYSWCLNYKPEVLKTAKERLFKLLEESAQTSSSDPLALARHEKIQSGFKRKDNVGEQTRTLVFRGFQEFFRSEGLTPFDQCWFQAT